MVHKNLFFLVKCSTWKPTELDKEILLDMKF